jgi:hypothetical protein
MKNHVNVDEWVAMFKEIGLDEAKMHQNTGFLRPAIRTRTRHFWSGWKLTAKRLTGFGRCLDNRGGGALLALPPRRLPMKTWR